MTRTVVAAALAILMAASASAQDPRGDDIKRWLTSYDAAFNAKDLTRLAAFYHADVTIYEGGSVNTGWADYRNHHLGPELEEMQSPTFSSQGPRHRRRGPGDAHRCQGFGGRVEDTPFPHLQPQASGESDAGRRPRLVSNHCRKTQHAREESMSHTMTSGPSAEMQKCITACDECRAACLTTVVHCLEKGGKHAKPEHIRLLLDCAEICATSAGFMLRGSDLHPRTCAVCAEVCERCAQSCESMGDDEQMRACAKACRQCAESCRRMASLA